MWKKLAITAVAVLGMAAPAMANEPCAQESSYIAPVVAAPVAQPVAYFGRDRREDYLRFREHQRWLRAQRFQHARFRYGHRW